MPQYIEKNPITYHLQCGQWNLDYDEISKSCSTTNEMIKPFNCNWIIPIISRYPCFRKHCSWLNSGTYFHWVLVNEECGASHHPALCHPLECQGDANWSSRPLAAQCAMFPFVNTLELQIRSRSAIFLTLIWVDLSFSHLDLSCWNVVRGCVVPANGVDQARVIYIAVELDL